MIIFLELALIIFLFLALYLMLQGAPFVPIHGSKLEKINKLANLRPGMKIADLGSGDGRIVIALAQAGAEAHGYEINPLLVLWSRHKIRKLKLSSRAFVHWKSFWSADFSSFDLIVIFGINHIMKRLENKLQRELKPGAKVVCLIFPLPTWPETAKTEKTYLYIKSL